MNTSNDNRPLFQLTVSEFNNLLKSAFSAKNVVEPQTTQTPRTKIHGIRGLSAFLGVSLPTAQKLKNERLIPFYMTGGKVFFFSDEVNASLKVDAKKKGSK